jgi:hypothetical protein
MDLEQLEKSFKDFINDNPEATRKALLRMTTEEEELAPTLNAAFQKVRPAAKGMPQISPFKDRSVIKMNGKVVNSKPKKLSDILTSEAESDELDWATSAPKVNYVKHADPSRRAISKDALRLAKAAVMRSQTNRAALEEHQGMINPKAMEILSRKLHEGALNVPTTRAAATLQTHPSGAVGNVKIPKHVPTEFDSVAARKADTLARIPPEFRIQKTEDRSFGAMAQRTKAAATLNRPKPEFKDTANNDQGDESFNQPSAKIPNIEPPIKDGESMAASTQKAHPNSQKQQFPRVLPSDTGDAIEDGRGYYR